MPALRSQTLGLSPNFATCGPVCSSHLQHGGTGPSSQGGFEESRCKALCTAPGTDEVPSEYQTEGRIHPSAADYGHLQDSSVQQPQPVLSAEDDLQDKAL